MPEIAGNQRESLEENSKHLQQKKKNQRRRRKTSLPKVKILEESTIWTVDSGASIHMTRFQKALTDYRTKKFTSQVELGDDTTYEIEGVGSIYFQLDSGTVLHIEDILYVLGLKKNLLLVACLEDEG